MQPEVGPHPTLRDLAAEIGTVLVYWSYLEAEMRRQLLEGDDRQPDRTPVVYRWRTFIRTALDSAICQELTERLDGLARWRNLLVHGIRTTSANPWREASAFVECSDLDGVIHRISIGEIRSLAEEIDRFRRGMRR
ncbi:hypothetical protein AMJ96_CH02644 [Rhizobium sp. N113]|uniref:hypothetical protein n=1 Tax=unclassified Rhizobium TaxID=2613769 RepID=UPI0007E9998F|nr:MULTISPECIES: hypothetical protein [unclassified Rhizobium]ANL10292.1 hypothetical protein AMJ98_CH02638 [Rhizobium sp. N1341]ANL22344.1 hypothetical protein AMJ96_CH02644 [Rhizobium sp. N113]ANM41116.1 hypothetical protein AMK03_CH02625 [Rhizobium sp. N741]